MGVDAMTSLFDHSTAIHAMRAVCSGKTELCDTRSRNSGLDF